MAQYTIGVNEVIQSKLGFLQAVKENQGCKYSYTQILDYLLTVELQVRKIHEVAMNLEKPQDRLDAYENGITAALNVVVPRPMRGNYTKSHKMDTYKKVLVYETLRDRLGIAAPTDAQIRYVVDHGGDTLVRDLVRRKMNGEDLTAVFDELLLKAR